MTAEDKIKEVMELVENRVKAGIDAARQMNFMMRFDLDRACAALDAAIESKLRELIKDGV